jgi:hypothetical protein
MTDEGFERHAFAILKWESGLDGLVRFLRLNRPTDGDYKRDRHRWLGGVRIQEIMSESESRRDPATRFGRMASLTESSAPQRGPEKTESASRLHDTPSRFRNGNWLGY